MNATDAGAGPAKAKRTRRGAAKPLAMVGQTLPEPFAAHVPADVPPDLAAGDLVILGQASAPLASEDEARPLDALALARLEDAFALGCTDREACLAADIDEAALAWHETARPAFVARKELLRETLALKARRCLAQALDNDPGLCLKFLERVRKEEFAPRRESGAKTKPPEAPPLADELSPEIEELIARVVARAATGVAEE